jgi:thioredoxin reductase (NADPH)
MAELLDCLIVGGGPAGLTAAIYAARFRLRVQVIDGGRSRAALIPLTRNYAGFPDGISGPDLLNRMRRHARAAGATVTAGEVTQLRLDGPNFVATVGEGQIASRAVLLATGVTNRAPAMAAETHTAALAAGRLRYCPVCDGMEVTDQAVGVIGTGEHGAREALFLRSYTADLVLIAPERRHELTSSQRQASRRWAGY